MATTPAPDEHGTAHAVVAAVKPRLRGWLHAGMVPLTVAAGIVLIALAPTSPARVAAAVFSVTAWLLFGTSAVYHRGNWSPRVAGVLKRLDHSNIFLIIAGSYTPFALLLPHDQAKTLLILVWSGAIGGVLFRVLWVHAPRWLYTPIHVGRARLRDQAAEPVTSVVRLSRDLPHADDRCVRGALRRRVADRLQPRRLAEPSAPSRLGAGRSATGP